MDIKKYLTAKKSNTSSRVRKGLACRHNGRSTDYVAPGLATGCPLACSYCVAEGTLIKTIKGQVPVEKIQDGDLLFSYDSSLEQLSVSRAQNIFCRYVDQVYEIEVNDKILVLTAEHPVYVCNKGWVKTEDLKEGDEVLYVCD